MSKRSEALIDSLKTALEAEAEKEAAIERARFEAMGRTDSTWLGTLDESTRAATFADREAVATVRDRKLIAGHPLRPASTDTQTGMTLRAVRATSSSEVEPSPKAE